MLDISSDLWQLYLETWGVKGIFEKFSTLLKQNMQESHELDGRQAAPEPFNP